MKLISVSVKDLAAETFTAPYFVPTEAVAVRSFGAEVNTSNEKNAVYLHPEHFELYRLGVFDDQTGVFSPELDEKQQVRPAMICRGEDLKRRLQ